MHVSRRAASRHFVCFGVCASREKRQTEVTPKEGVETSVTGGPQKGFLYKTETGNGSLILHDVLTRFSLTPFLCLL